MREIKFRVWDSQFNKMLDSKDIVMCTATGRVKGKNGGFGFVNTWRVLQYTGLKDSKGVKIYERDILCLFYGIPRLKAILEVVWLDGSFKVLCKNAQPQEMYLGELKLDLNCTEVIGNIYENPELVEQECGARIMKLIALNELMPVECDAVKATQEALDERLKAVQDQRDLYAYHLRRVLKLGPNLHPLELKVIRTALEEEK